MTTPAFKMERRPPNVPPDGLMALDRVDLGPRGRHLLDQATRTMQGSNVWRSRKAVEVRDALALEQMADRLAIVSIDGRETLRIMARMQVPVPCMPPGGTDLFVLDEVLLGLSYPEAVLWAPQPGYRFVQILRPPGLWHAQVAADPVQPLCLGATLPAGIPVRELFIMTYAALSMQTVMIDTLDSAGVLNAPAAEWWQRNRDRIPLTRSAFLDPVGVGPK
jgi:hypothetical protein